MHEFETAGKPRLLFLAQTLPFPPDGGVNIRTYNVLRLLSRSFRITALCFYRRATRPSGRDVAAGVEALKEFAHVEAFPIPQEHSRLRLIRDHLHSVITRRVYTVPAYFSTAYRDRVLDLVHSGRFALVHVDSLDLSAYLPLVTSIPTILVHHNVESALLLQRAEAESSLLRRWYMRRQSALMEQEERRWSASVALSVTVSEADRILLQQMVPAARLDVVPNGVDTSAFQPGAATNESLIFVGGYNWFPNRDALDYFCSDILPILKERHPDIKVQWVGRVPDHIRTGVERDHDGMQMTGYVDDIRPYVQPASCYIVPLRLGGGTRLKILDAWAMGKAVVSTSVGCEGLDAQDGENILIGNTPEEFAQAIHNILCDPALRSTLEEGARATAVATYDWEVIGRHLLAAYRRVLMDDSRH